MKELFDTSEGAMQTYDEIVRGKVASPFSEKELDVLNLLMEDCVHNPDIAVRLGVGAETIKDRKDKIRDIVKAYVGSFVTKDHHLGSDFLAMALSLAVSAGWVKPEGFNLESQPLNEEEMKIVYLKSNGFSNPEIAEKTGIKSRKLNKKLDMLQKIIGVDGPYALCAWGAWRGRQAYLAKADNQNVSV